MEYGTSLMYSAEAFGFDQQQCTDDDGEICRGAFFSQIRVVLFLLFGVALLCSSAVLFFALQRCSSLLSSGASLCSLAVLFFALARCSYLLLRVALQFL
jgi:hypothetical protein